jgi:hypothetical protein
MRELVAYQNNQKARYPVQSSRGRFRCPRRVRCDQLVPDAEGARGGRDDSVADRQLRARARLPLTASEAAVVNVMFESSGIARSACTALAMQRRPSVRTRPSAVTFQHSSVAFAPKRTGLGRHRQATIPPSRCRRTRSSRTPAGVGADRQKHGRRCQHQIDAEGSEAFCCRWRSVA